jgi:hypothetical protein
MKKQLASLIICIIAISLTLGCAGLNNPYDIELTGEWETNQGGSITTWEFDGFGNFTYYNAAVGTDYGTYTTNAGTMTISAPTSPGVPVSVVNYTIENDLLTVEIFDSPGQRITFYRKGTNNNLFDPELTGTWALNYGSMSTWTFDGYGEFVGTLTNTSKDTHEGTYTTFNNVLTIIAPTYQPGPPGIFEYQITENTMVLTPIANPQTTINVYREGTNQEETITIRLEQGKTYPFTIPFKLDDKTLASVFGGDFLTDTGPSMNLSNSIRAWNSEAQEWEIFWNKNESGEAQWLLFPNTENYNDVEIDWLGKGLYLIAKNGTYDLTFTGTPITEKFPLQVKGEFSFVGAPYCNNYTASDAMESLITTGTDCNKIYVADVESGFMLNYYRDNPTDSNEFVIDSTTGFWVGGCSDNTDILWTPDC